MHITLFDYDLPEHLIAAQPCPERDRARLLVVRRGGSVLGHHHVHELPSLLDPGDLLVLNDTRVLPARLMGRRAHTEGKWEGLFLRERPDGTWELMCQTRGRLIVGETLLVDPPASGTVPPLRLCLVSRTPEGCWLARPEAEGTTAALLARHGRVPLPPYIRKARAGRAEEEADRERYQTVFARHDGAVAAPTAGLHFTPALFEALDRRGINRQWVTLHIGAGTFQPMQAEDVTAHRVQPEWGELSAETAEAITAAKAHGRRVVAVGTTTVRVLETAARVANGLPGAWSGMTDLTICPPYAFAAVDALVTNFHLPRSSLLLLVAAFTGLDSLRAAYQTAIAEEYRFYSYGDAMMIL